MDSEYDLQRWATEYINANQDSLRRYIIEQILSGGFDFTFGGVFTQSLASDPSLEDSIPFGVAQTPEQEAQMGNGILEGRIYDYGEISKIKGTISPESIQFKKRYQPRSEQDTRIPINPDLIYYTGSSQDGLNYEGRWSFNSDVADMAKQGNFKMTRIKLID